MRSLFTPFGTFEDFYHQVVLNVLPQIIPIVTFFVKRWTNGTINMTVGCLISPCFVWLLSSNLHLKRLCFCVINIRALGQFY